MTNTERQHLIDSLCFLTGKESWWWEGKTLEELIKEYDRLQEIY